MDSQHHREYSLPAQAAVTIAYSICLVVVFLFLIRLLNTFWHLCQSLQLYIVLIWKTNRNNFFWAESCLMRSKTNKHKHPLVCLEQAVTAVFVGKKNKQQNELLWITYRSNLAALCQAAKSAEYAVLSVFLACRSSANTHIGRFLSVIGPNSRSCARDRTSLNNSSAASYFPCFR